MEQNQRLRNPFKDPSFLDEIEKARQFKKELHRRRTKEIPTYSVGSG